MFLTPCHVLAPRLAQRGRLLVFALGILALLCPTSVLGQAAQPPADDDDNDDASPEAAAEDNVPAAANAPAAANNPAEAKTPAAANNPSAPVALPEVVVNGRADSLLGLADSASQGTTGAAELADRPLLRAGEILETVPGVIITQHAGGGKANQYFLRGFNLDHGTDFAVFLDGMPLNLPTHAHGQGYADMNVVIPELVQRVNYEKGPYFADVGDFGSAGAAHLDFFRRLPQDLARVEAGMFGYARGMFGVSHDAGAGTVLLGGEACHDDGPWTHPDNYNKLNGLFSWSQGGDSEGESVTARAYHGDWRSTDQVPESFYRQHPYGSMNPDDGGESQRYSVQGEWHRAGAGSATQVTAYGFYYDLDLFSDFTYFLNYPTQGDQFEQQDQRAAAGLDARQTFFNKCGGMDLQDTIGLQVENYWIDNGIYTTVDRARVAKTDASGAAQASAVIKKDAIVQSQVALFAENHVEWTRWFRSTIGLRGDLYNSNVHDQLKANSGNVVNGLVSPKASLVFGPWAATELYLNGGQGFHSNDARAVTATVNPDASFVGGRAMGLVPTEGAEVGVRTLAVPGLQSTLSLWYLYSESELMMDGDTGDTVASKSPSDRYGVEWTNYLTILKALAFDLDAADSWARFRQVDAADAAPGSPGGRNVPEAVGVVVSTGLTLHDLDGFSAAARLRFFGPRNLTSDGRVQSSATAMVNAEVAYRFSPVWRVFAEGLNMLNRRDQDIAYFYESRVSPTAAPAFQVHLHPTEPLQLRVGVEARF
jgi:hypothetical protein